MKIASQSAETGVAKDQGAEKYCNSFWMWGKMWLHLFKDIKRQKVEPIYITWNIKTFNVVSVFVVSANFIATPHTHNFS